jgi:hypothetical protein
MNKTPRRITKLLFYTFFAVLGTTLAEVFTVNATDVAYKPLAYLPYGLLYVLFIDVLMARRVESW